jgi:phosphatidylserine decarboxylase
MEVGALCVGKIKNYISKKTIRGQEKGHFEFGGSTIIIFIKKDIVKVDQDIIENSSAGIETRVKQGERIGIKI